MLRVIALLLAMGGVAAAHSWYDPDCCSTRDCYPVPTESVIETEDGWKHLPTGATFKDTPHMKRIRPSKDRSFHVCIRGDQNTGYVGLCIYILQGA